MFTPTLCCSDTSYSLHRSMNRDISFIRNSHSPPFHLYHWAPKAPVSSNLSLLSVNPQVLSMCEHVQCTTNANSRGLWLSPHTCIMYLCTLGYLLLYSLFIMTFGPVPQFYLKDIYLFLIYLFRNTQHCAIPVLCWSPAQDISHVFCVPVNFCKNVFLLFTSLF